MDPSWGMEAISQTGGKNIGKIQNDPSEVVTIQSRHDQIQLIKKGINCPK